MTNEPVRRSPHRYQPEDQFNDPTQLPVTEPTPTTQASPFQSLNTEPLAATAQSTTSQPIDPNLAASAYSEPAEPPIDRTANPAAGTNQKIADEIFLEWDAPSRPHKKRKKQYYTTIAIILILIGLILFFAGQFIPIAVLAAAGFLVYVLEMVPPTLVHHSISVYGFKIEGTLYYWNQLGRFWFSERYGKTLLQIETFRFPNRLTVLTGDTSKEDLIDLLSEVLVFEQPPLTPFEKAAAWLEKTLPLETESPPKNS